MAQKILYFSLDSYIIVIYLLGERTTEDTMHTSYLVNRVIKIGLLVSFFGALVYFVRAIAFLI